MLAPVQDLIGGTVHYLVPFLLMITPIVFFHELGHFLVARACGVLPRADVCAVGAKPGIVAIASNDIKASDSEIENTNSFVRCMGVSVWHEWNSIVITFCPGE